MFALSDRRAPSPVRLRVGIRSAIRERPALFQKGNAWISMRCGEALVGLGSRASLDLEEKC
jgi:hypothetical protein